MRKKILSVILATLMVALMLPFSSLSTFALSQSIAQGICGDNLKWQLSKDGILDISGTGDMKISYDSGWDDYKEKIITVVINDGVTSIDSWAFMGCHFIKSVQIPEGLSFIGDNAFFDCVNLVSINMPDSITEIDEFAFGNCMSLKRIALGGGIDTIKKGTFNGCYSLNNLIVPENVEKIESKAFWNCFALKNITIFNPNCIFDETNGSIFEEKMRTTISGEAFAEKYKEYVIKSSDPNIGNLELTPLVLSISASYKETDDGMLPYINIFGLKDSTAQDYAQKHNVSFIDLSDIDNSRDANNCNHLCHQTGFVGFIWKIANLFNKIFGTNKVCKCGINHY